MLEGYRVLAAMLALGEFTVDDLVRESGANAATARTTIARNSSLTEYLGETWTGRRGGAWKRYRLTPGGANEIRERLADVEGLSPGGLLGGVPPELMAAEHLLSDEWPEEADSESRDAILEQCRQLAHSAHRAMQSAAASPRGLHPEAAAHAVAVDILLRLAEAEVGSPTAGETWRELNTELDQHNQTLRSVRASSSLYDQLRNRLRGSSLAERDRFGGSLSKQVRVPSIASGSAIREGVSALMLSNLLFRPSPLFQQYEGAGRDVNKAATFN